MLPWRELLTSISSRNSTSKAVLWGGESCWISFDDLFSSSALLLKQWLCMWVASFEWNLMFYFIHFCSENILKCFLKAFILPQFISHCSFSAVILCVLVHYLFFFLFFCFFWQSYPSNYMDQMKPNKYSVIYSAPSMLHNKFYSNPDRLSNGIQMEPVDLTVNKRSSPPSAGSSPSPLKFQTVHRRTSPGLTLSSPSSPISKFTPSPPGVQPLSMPITIPPVMAAALSRHGLRSPGILPVIQPVVVQPVPFMYAPHLQQPIMVSTVLTDEMESPSSMQGWCCQSCVFCPLILGKWLYIHFLKYTNYTRIIHYVNISWNLAGLHSVAL